MKKLLAMLLALVMVLSFAACGNTETPVEGENTEVTDNTVDVFIESAYFQPTCVRRTSTRLGLRSEASIRFEKGINMETVLTAAERAAQLMQLTGGGVVVGGAIDNHPTKHEAGKSKRTAGY